MGKASIYWSSLARARCWELCLGLSHGCEGSAACSITCCPQDVCEPEAGISRTGTLTLTLWYGMWCLNCYTEHLSSTLPKPPNLLDNEDIYRLVDLELLIQEVWGGTGGYGFLKQTEGELSIRKATKGEGYAPLEILIAEIIPVNYFCIHSLVFSELTRQPPPGTCSMPMTIFRQQVPKWKTESIVCVPLQLESVIWLSTGQR